MEVLCRAVIMKSTPWLVHDESCNPREQDPFSDEALFHRVKSPNQCAGYKTGLAPDPQETFVSLEVLEPYSFCVSYLTQTHTHTHTLEETYTSVVGWLMNFLCDLVYNVPQFPLISCC